MGEVTVTSRTKDAILWCEANNKPKFLGFLTVEECAAIKPLLKNVYHGFWGGTQNAERVILGIFPDWYEEQKSDYPVVAVTACFKSEYTLTHRDFLGAIMSQSVEREKIGDILVGSGQAVIFIHQDIANFIILQISKVGNVGVTLKKGMPEILPENSRLVYKSGTVASNRLDCTVCEIIGKGRSFAQNIIDNGLVTVNSGTVNKSTYCVKAGDVIKARGFGRFTIINNTKITKKGRIILEYSKYI